VVHIQSAMQGIVPPLVVSQLFLPESVLYKQVLFKPLQRINVQFPLHSQQTLLVLHHFFIIFPHRVSVLYFLHLDRQRIPYLLVGLLEMQLFQIFHLEHYAWLGQHPQLVREILH